MKLESQLVEVGGIRLTAGVDVEHGDVGASLKIVLSINLKFFSRGAQLKYYGGPKITFKGLK